ncbi:hypothetical protein TorRG33x02_348210 [Trema orientale]|uniref:Uncharacterized protein n=1 Tax=Trema orientale TaxID=63057 RepID=A0A2P5AKC6_TREOI|nr:hypothetical protein TorRG33x02_348210 [Trema orientale]
MQSVAMLCSQCHGAECSGKTSRASSVAALYRQHRSTAFPPSFKKKIQKGKISWKYGGAASIAPQHYWF